MLLNEAVRTGSNEAKREERGVGIGRRRRKGPLARPKGSERRPLLVAEATTRSFKFSPRRTLLKQGLK